MCLVVTCWERADLLALVCGVQLCVCHFPIGILGYVWYLIVSISDLCTLIYFQIYFLSLLKKTHLYKKWNSSPVSSIVQVYIFAHLEAYHPFASFNWEPMVASPIFDYF